LKLRPCGQRLFVATTVTGVSQELLGEVDAVQ
jgi:hypothetical protein